MAYSKIVIPGDGSTKLLTINFPLGVLANETVTVRVSGELTDRAFTWQSANTILVSGVAATNAQNYTVQRRTPRTALMVNWMDGIGITNASLNTDQLQALHLIHECLDQAAAGESAVEEAPSDNLFYVRRNALWESTSLSTIPGLTAELAGKAPSVHTHTISQIAGLQTALDNAGTMMAFSSRANAIAATVPAEVQIIAVVHSAQGLFYRRYTGGNTQAQTDSALKTNAGTVFWAPVGNFSPLHWGAAGDGVTNDRFAFAQMFRFMYGVPATNSSMPNAFAEARPFVVTGHNRIYATAAPINLGNTGGEPYQTGMVYNLRLDNLRLKGIPGDWTFDYDVGIPRSLLNIAWQFGENVSDDSKTGMYDILLDKVDFDCSMIPSCSGTFAMSTYMLTLNDCKVKHIGKNGFGVQQSDHVGANTAHGFSTRNGAMMIKNINIEGIVTESGIPYPGAETIATMNTTGLVLPSLDWRVDAPIISGVTVTADIEGRAGMFYNLHPWSRLVKIGANANNLMFANGYLDYTKFELKSFKHSFVGMHWIIPSDPAADRGIDLIATKVGETGADLIFSGCSFDFAMDIKFKTEGIGTWVGDKQKLLTITGCRYGPLSTLTQIERFRNLHGITPATNAHWFSVGDPTRGEVRMLSNLVHIGKDRTADGAAALHLHSQLGDQATASFSRDAGTNGNLYINNLAGTGGLALGLNNGLEMMFGQDGDGIWSGDAFAVGKGRGVDGAAAYQLFNKSGVMSASLTSFAGVGINLTNWQTNGWIGLSNLANSDAIRLDPNGSTSIKSVSTTATDATLNVRRPTTTGTLIGFGVQGGADATGKIWFATANTVAYLTGSDERLKQDFKALSPDIVDRLPVYDFEWISDGLRGHGVKAQEIEGVVPSAVVPGDETERWMVDYAMLVPALLAAVQDLRKRVAELERK